MLTSRGWWLLLFILTLLAMGGIIALRGPATLLLVGLSLFLWFVWELAAFAVQARIVRRRIRITPGNCRRSIIA